MTQMASSYQCLNTARDFGRDESVRVLTVSKSKKAANDRALRNYRDLPLILNLADCREFLNLFVKLGRAIARNNAVVTLD